jgi:hypothetical protein
LQGAKHRHRIEKIEAAKLESSEARSQKPEAA